MARGIFKQAKVRDQELPEHVESEWWKVSSCVAVIRAASRWATNTDREELTLPNQIETINEPTLADGDNIDGKEKRQGDDVTRPILILKKSAESSNIAYWRQSLSDRLLQWRLSSMRSEFSRLISWVSEEEGGRNRRKRKSWRRKSLKFF